MFFCLYSRSFSLLIITFCNILFCFFPSQFFSSILSLSSNIWRPCLKNSFLFLSSHYVFHFSLSYSFHFFSYYIWSIFNFDSSLSLTSFFFFCILVIIILVIISIFVTIIQSTFYLYYNQYIFIVFILYRIIIFFHFHNATIIILFGDRNSIMLIVETISISLLSVLYFTIYNIHFYCIYV